MQEGSEESRGNKNKVEVEYQENSVYVGKKPAMKYVTSVITQSQTFEEIHLRARGHFISKAAEVSQISINRFLEGWTMGVILIITEEQQVEIPGQDSFQKKVTSIDIPILKLLNAE